MVRSATRHTGGQVIRLLGVLFLSALLLSSPAGGAAAEQAEESPPTILGLTLTQGGSTMAVFQVTGEDLPVPAVLSTDDNALTLLWEGTSLPSGTWQKTFPTPLVQGVTLKQEADGVVMRVLAARRLYLSRTVGDPPSPLMHLHLTTGEAEAEDIPLPVMGVPKVIAGDPFASSSPVTLQLRDSDLRDVFRMLGTMVKMNVVIDPSVPATAVTISLNNVPMNEAFAYLMRMYDVSYALMGKTIIIGKKDNLSRTMGMEKTRSFRVSYITNEELDGISNLLHRLCGVAEAGVVVDKRLRAVYVPASEERLEDVAVTLQRIDHPGRQVMLQARIVEVSASGSAEVKSLVNAVYERWYASFSSTGGTLGYYDDVDKTGIYDPSRTNREINLPESITFPDMADSALGFFDASLQLLVKQEKAKMLASPSVVTLDGQKASIKLLTDIKYVSERDDQGRPTYGEVESGPALEFTPTVGRSEIVTIEMNVKTGDAKLTYDSLLRGYIPESSTREVETVVRVRDGEPFVVGGLFHESKTDNVWKIPVISEIPLLGELFKGKSSSVSKSEVIMVVVPYILDVPESPILGSDVRLN